MNQSLPFFLLLAICVVCALLVAVYPLPAKLSPYRPECLCLLVIYWVLYAPHHVGVGVAWCIGLVQDIVEGAVWGGHAFALAFLAYICLMSYRRLRSHALSQQAFWVFVFVGIHQIFVNWFQGFDGYDGRVAHIIISALVTAALWPILVITMRSLHRRYRLF